MAAIGPWVRNSIESSGIGHVGIRPSVGLIPNVPHIDEGAVIDPAESVPVAPGTSPAATAAADPPLEPPVVRLGSRGLRDSGPSRFLVSPSSPNAGVFVLPTITAPAARSRETTMQSSSGTLSRKASEPYVVRRPRVSWRSFTPIGTPSSGPVSPLASRRSASSAAASAPSASTVRNAARWAARRWRRASS